MTKNIIRYATFDAKELNNTDKNRANYGNNRWTISNIRQWLNSNSEANKWFTAQHTWDSAPSNDYIQELLMFAQICYLANLINPADDRYWYLIESIKNN